MDGYTPLQKKVDSEMTATDVEISLHSFHQFDIPTDAYGSAILAICRDAPEVFCGPFTGITVVKFVFALMLLALNLALQFSILFFINSQVVDASVRHVQEIYQDFHASVFNEDGQFVPELWETESSKDELCQIAMTSRMFYYCTLFLWTVSMLGEFRTSQRLMSNILQLPHCRNRGEMIEVSEEAVFIKKLIPSVRYALLFIVCTPKLCIAGSLLLVGWRWLSATTSFEALVMNSVAMEFVTRIDDMLYEFAVPESYKKEVADINFFLHTAPKSDAQLICEEWKSYLRSGGYLCLAMVMVVVYAEYFQDVLPPGIHDVKDHCALFIATESTPICHGIISALLTGKSFDSCYPYGTPSDL